MGRRVAIIGTGMTKSGTSPVSSWLLFGEAAMEAVAEAGIKITDIQGVHIGNAYGATIENQTNMSPLIVSMLGLDNNIPCARYEAACCSGSLAFREAYINILSGMYDLILVGGTERLRSAPGSQVQAVFATGMDETARNAGLTFGAYWAYVIKRYARKYGIPLTKMQELLAEISVKNHFHGSFNEKAQFQKQITVPEVMNSPMVSPPVKMLDSCPFSDGAAAVILASEDRARDCKNPIWVEGSGLASGKFQFYQREDLASNPALDKAVSDAYKQAKMGPKDIDIAEVHDCTNINEVLCLEHSGLFKQGEGVYSAAEHKTYFDGELPVNCSGGLKSRGHPVGATGAYQICEIARQLRGDWKGKKPQNNPEVGITVNCGGGGTVITTHILRKG